MPVQTEKIAAREILERGEIAPDGVLVVHSAFRNLSRSGFRAERFIEALLEGLPGGTLVMPAMSWRICTPENPYFDEVDTPSIVGVLSEVFRTSYATTRSIHPTHSFSACGPLAETLVTGHSSGDTPCSAESPIGRLPGVGAQILLLGVWFESCTLIHYPEEKIAPDLYLRPPDGVIYQCRDRRGQVREVQTRRHVRLNRDFSKFASQLAAQGKLTTGDVCETPWGICRADELCETVFAALHKRRDGTLADT